MFGNDFTKRTYGLVSSKIHHLPMSVTSVPEILNNRNYATAKTKFVWLNSHGALLKGLDVIIDAFTILPDMELHILGDMEREAKFMNAISCELHAAPNIKFEGWIDINESHFKEIATGCAWVIGASFSEGGGGSILNCMAKGLIPVISRSSSISLPEKTGFYVEENNATGLVALLKIITTLPAAELQAMSSNAYNFIAANHTLENFKARYKEFLIQTSQPEVINHD
jgi:glycosyltransferase involved in cell wall biosynthesis